MEYFRCINGVCLFVKLCFVICYALLCSILFISVYYLIRLESFFLLFSFFLTKLGNYAMG